MEKEIIKKITFTLSPEERQAIIKTGDIVSNILLMMEGEDSETLELEYYEITMHYSFQELENFCEFLEYLPDSDNEVF